MSRDLIDDIEIGTALVGIILLATYGFEIVPDERLLMLALAIMALAVGLDNRQSDRPRDRDADDTNRPR